MQQNQKEMNDAQKILKPLPCGIQEFENLRLGGYFYVDKTEFVYKLAQDKEIFNSFLGRPRRFGKSLFLSTLEAYFKGRKELFEGLKIYNLETQWKKYEVLRFDFSGCENIEFFLSKIKNKIKEYETFYNYTSCEEQIGIRLANLIKKAAEYQLDRVVLLFDEYDSALNSNLYNDEVFKELQSHYRSIFSCLKSESKYIHKIFLTGIMKFTQLSIFSTLNNVSIISANDDYAAVCGFTHQELKTAWLDYAKRFAEKRNLSVSTVYDKILEYYDSYCFSKSLTKIINPYSLVKCFIDNELNNYWINSGLSKSLFYHIDNGTHKMPNWECEYIDKEKLEWNDCDKNDLILTLYQSGYFTIKNYDEDLRIYYLSVPNVEVKESIIKMLIPRLLQKKQNEAEAEILNIKTNIANGNIDVAMSHFQTLVAETFQPKKKL